MNIRKLIYFILMTFSPLMMHAQWTSVTTGVSTKLESIYFWNSTNGIMSFTAGVAKTTNGGMTWTNPGGSFFGFRDIDFASTTVGYAAGISAYALKKTIDGGTTWTSLTPVNSTSMWGVSAPDANTAYFSGGGCVWKTTNGGTTVTAVNIPGNSNYMVDLDFVSITEGYVLDQVGGVYKTINGGTTWTLSYPSTGTLYTSIYFVNSTTGFACGSGGKIVRTTNSGSTWTVLTTGSTSYLQYIHFYDVNNGICAGLGGEVIRTVNGGASWFHDNIPLPKFLYSCWLLSPTVAVVGGDTGVFYRNANLTTSIDQPEPAAAFTASPNPCTDKLSISVADLHSSAELRFELFSTNGKRVAGLTGTVSAGRVWFDVAALKPGLYVGELYDRKQRVSIVKFVKTQ